MGIVDVKVTKILREFEKSFQFENWKIYSSSEMGASLIEDETRNFFYVITGSDRDYKPIPLKRLQKTVLRYSKYKGKNICKILYLAHSFSKQALEADKNGNLTKLYLIKFDVESGEVDLLSSSESTLLTEVLKTFISKCISDAKQRRIMLYGITDESSKVIAYSQNEPREVENVPSKIRVLAFSDWRIQDINDVTLFLKQTEPVDLILYAGDDIGRFESFENNVFSELASHTSSGLVLAVLGNDDIYWYSKQVLRGQGVCDLYDQSIVFGEYAFIGLESSTSGPAVFKHSESDYQKQLETQLRKLKEKKLVIVSHTPPFGILDSGIRFSTKEEGVRNIGSTALRGFIDKHRVEAVICGHCHSNGGLSKVLNSSKVINVASHDNLGSIGRIAIITLSETGVEVEWHDTFEVRPATSVRRVYGIGPAYEERLNKANITTVEQLSRLSDLYVVARSTGLSVRQLRMFQLKAQSMIKQETYQVAPFNIQDEKVIYLDIETDTACERVWLIGLLIHGHFTRLYADSWDQEREILENFLNILKEHEGYTLISYSGTNFDHRVPLGAIMRHGLDAEFFRIFPHIDLCTMMKSCFIFPNRSFALKNIGAYLEYPFKHGDLDGFMVAIEYLQHVNTGKALDRTVLEYNEDDVRVLPHIIDRCRILKTKRVVLDF